MASGVFFNLGSIGFNPHQSLENVERCIQTKDLAGLCSSAKDHMSLCHALPQKTFEAIIRTGIEQGHKDSSWFASLFTHYWEDVTGCIIAPCIIQETLDHFGMAYADHEITHPQFLEALDQGNLADFFQTHLAEAAAVPQVNTAPVRLITLIKDKRYAEATDRVLQTVITGEEKKEAMRLMEVQECTEETALLWEIFLQLKV